MVDFDVASKYSVRQNLISSVASYLCYLALWFSKLLYRRMLHDPELNAFEYKGGFYP